MPEGLMRLFDSRNIGFRCARSVMRWTKRLVQTQLPLALEAPQAATDALPYLQVRRHPRARRLSIRVHAGGRVVVVVPRRSSARSVEAFINEHRDWIIRTSRKLSPIEPLALPSHIELPAIGRSFALDYAGSHERRVRWAERGDTLVLHTSAEDAPASMAVLRDWLLAQARRQGPAQVAAIAAETGLEPSRLQFRLQRTRWGSCSSRGTVSLNACMLFLEGRLLRYLLLHELCHLRHMNHSKRYWDLVARFEPDCRALDRELDDAWRRVPAWVFGHLA